MLLFDQLNFFSLHKYICINQGSYFVVCNIRGAVVHVLGKQIQKLKCF